jgi:3-methyladenine DNA glycosylase AlkC
MAEPLKNHFGADVPVAIASMVSSVHPNFAGKAFVRDALDGYEPLSLTGRGWHLAHTLRKHLPQDYPKAVQFLLDSSGQPSGRRVGSGMGGFLFMPHCFFVAEYGLAHFEASMAAQHALTQRFTCEFSIRPFLIHHQVATLKRLRQWTGDPSEHVRRLVSEGTRPRLPWAMRLPAFQADPTPVLDLLELLKDDPALYVRRSVANNLNDIGKDHPRVLSGIAVRWLQHVSPQREWVVRHALRWAVKQGEPGALKALGFGRAAIVEIANVAIEPQNARMGGDVTIRFDLRNATARPQDLMVDLAVHYVKASGASSAKVFKLRALTLGPGETASFQKKLSLREMTTRKHFKGAHQVDALVNGKALPLGSFELLELPI